MMSMHKLTAVTDTPTCSVTSPPVTQDSELATR